MTTVEKEPRLNFQTRVAVFAYNTRRRIARVDNPEVKNARRLARATRANKVDVVYFGDSTTTFTAPYDQDKRTLYKMVHDALGTGVRTKVVQGGSYHPPLYNAFLRLSKIENGRPVVIVPLCIRVRNMPWIEHPIFGHKNAVNYLSQLDPSTPWWRIRAGFPRPTSEEFTEYYKRSHPTWYGDYTIGEYAERLKPPAPEDDDWVKGLYSYHHGGRVELGEHLEEVALLGANLRRLGARVVVYQTPVPVEKGQEYWGPEFLDLAQKNFALLDDAFNSGWGEDAHILQTGVTARTDEFIDFRDASEHLNEHGRLRLAADISAATLEALKR